MGLGKLGRFFRQVSLVAPVVLAFTPLAPVAESVTAAIQEAEALLGERTGAAKLAHVQAVVRLAAEVANAAAGKERVRVEALDAVVAHATAAVISATKVVVH